MKTVCNLHFLNIRQEMPKLVSFPDPQYGTRTHTREEGLVTKCLGTEEFVGNNLIGSVVCVNNVHCDVVCENSVDDNYCISSIRCHNFHSFGC